MKTYVVRVYDSVAVYDIDAENKAQAEKLAAEKYKSEKDNWLAPRLVEVEDEYESEK